MRLHPVPLLLISSLLLAQARDPWDRFLSSHRSEAWQQQSFLFIAHGGDFTGPWVSDKTIQQLLASGEFKIQSIQEEEANALWERQGWGTEARWVLVGPKGDLVANGGGPPEADDLVRAMRSAGWQPQSERLEAFLREHPDQGEAWAQEVLAHLDNPKTSKDADSNPSPKKRGKGGDAAPSPADENKDAELERALAGFTGVDGWAQWSGLDSFLAALESGIPAPSANLKETFATLRRGVERELQRRPSDPGLWSAWGRLARLAPGDSPQVMFSGLEPAPRQPWPPPQAASVLADGFRATADWPGLESLASDALGQAMSPNIMLRGDARAFRRDLLMAWAPLKVEAILQQKHQDQAISFISETCALAGRDWLNVSHAISLIPPPEGVDHQAWEEALTQPQQADRALLVQAPLHLFLLGNPAWRASYESLRKSPSLRAWDPERELDWSSPNAREGRVLAQQPWPPGPRWVLMRGGEVLDTGTDLPNAQDLAERLRKFGEPFLGELTAFLRTHPDQLEARRLRFDRLLARMPELNWEATLLEDARALQIAPHGKDDWTPSDFLWQPASKRMLPEIEARIRRWPGDAPGWEGWTEWAAFNPLHPHPASLLAGLGIWRWSGEPGPLPLPVLLKVGRLLKAQGAWDALAEWCEAFWTRGLRDYAGELAAPALSGKQGSQAQDKVLELQSALFDPWQEALHRLSRDAEWRRVRLELESRNPALSNWLRGRTR